MRVRQFLGIKTNTLLILLDNSVPLVVSAAALVALVVLGASIVLVVLIVFVVTVVLDAVDGVAADNSSGLIKSFLLRLSGCPCYFIQGLFSI